jgi:hypothetical protein
LRDNSLGVFLAPGLLQLSLSPSPAWLAGWWLPLPLIPFVASQAKPVRVGEGGRARDFFRRFLGHKKTRRNERRLGSRVYKYTIERTFFNGREIFHESTGCLRVKYFWGEEKGFSCGRSVQSKNIALLTSVNPGLVGSLFQLGGSDNGESGR